VQLNYHRQEYDYGREPIFKQHHGELLQDKNTALPDPSLKKEDSHICYFLDMAGRRRKYQSYYYVQRG